METIGEHLRRVRRTCGYSLEDVARVTKINLRYLEAIENDEFSKLPGETFLQGFLRSYARFLGINEREIFSKFNERKGAEALPPDTSQIKEGRKEEREKRRPLIPGNIRAILPLGAGIIVLLVIIILLGGRKNTSTIESSKEVKEVIVEPIEEKHDQAQATQPVAEPVALARPILLKIYAKELTWVQAKINDDEVKEALLKPGESVLWEGEDKITMTLGNAGGVEAEINGKAQEPFGKSGEVVRNIVISSTGVTKGVNEGVTTGVTESVGNSSKQLINPPP